MSAEAAIIHTFLVGPWTVRLSVPAIRRGAVNHAVCDWEPAMPNRPFTEAEQRQYESGVAHAFRAAAEAKR